MCFSYRSLLLGCGRVHVSARRGWVAAVNMFRPDVRQPGSNGRLVVVRRLVRHGALAEALDQRCHMVDEWH